ncbi:MAG: hypothetical protein ACQES8_07945 [Thermodesulfobacteriota bacterium]
MNSCQGQPVPHLTAKVVGLEEGMSKKEVKSYLEEPDFRQKPSKVEKWIYYHVNKSLLRKTPLIGRFMGSAQVDVVSVEFRQNKVIGFQYQSMTPEEFKKKDYHRNG